jgi:RNA 2',3'-cyclic 3'-phosphodiesterase
MRLFVAVDLSTKARDAIQSALDDFPVPDPPWRWVAPENWHITLKFLGERNAAQIDSLNAALGEIARRHHGFDMALGAFGGFPSLRHPRVLFYNVEHGAAELESLAGDVDAAVERAIGLALDGRGFHSHVTIARVKDRLSPDIVARFALVPPLTDAVTRVSTFRLIESRLQRTGAVYSVVKEFALP